MDDSHDGDVRHNGGKPVFLQEMEEALLERYGPWMKREAIRHACFEAGLGLFQTVRVLQMHDDGMDVDRAIQEVKGMRVTYQDLVDGRKAD